MGNKVIIASIGPYQFINALGYTIQNQLNNDIIGVIRYNGTFSSLPPNLLKCEKWLYNLFGIPFLSPPTNLYQIWGKNPVQKLLHIIDLRARIRREIQNLLPDISVLEITDVVIPFRLDLQDILLIDVFNNARIHYVSDGFFVGDPINFNIPIPLRLLGIKNPFHNNNINEISVIPGLEKGFEKFGLLTLLDLNLIKKEIYYRIIKEPQFNNWLKFNFASVFEREKSIFLIQPVDRYMNLKDEVEFYKKVIREELNKSPNLILIKFHPRDSPSKIQFIRNELINLFNKNIYFFPDDYLSSVPFEVFYEVLKINNLVGIFSTPLLLSNVYDSLHSSIYCGKDFPESIKNGAKAIADFLNEEIIEL